MTSSTTRAFVARKPFATASAFMAKTNQLLSTMASLRLLLVMFVALTVSVSAWAETYTHSFNTTGTLRPSGNSVTLGDVTWNVNATVGKGDPTYNSIVKGYSDYGWQFGSSSKNYYSKVILSTNAFSSYNVQSVVLNMRLNGGVSTTMTVKQGSTTIGTATMSTANVWTDLVANATKGTGGDLSITIATTQAFFIHSITVTYEDAVSSCSVKPTVDNALQSITVTENSIKAIVPISAVGGCNITENGLVYSTTNSTPIVDGSGCVKVTTTACGSTAANKTVTITGLNCGTSYYIRGYATNEAGTSYTNVTTTSTSDCPKYTVTFHTSAIDEHEEVEESAGAGVTPPSMEEVCGEWRFQGWSESYSDSETSTTELKLVTLTDGKYYPTDDVHLYPVYSKTISSGSAFSDYQKVTTNLDDWSGKYLLSTGTYTATGVYSSNHLTCTNDAPGNVECSGQEFTLSKVGNVGYSILMPNGNYLGYSGSSTNFSSSPNVPTSTSATFLWTPSTSGISNVSATARKISTNNDNTDFRPYSSPSSGIVYLYKRIENSSTIYYYSYPSCTTETSTSTYTVKHCKEGLEAGSYPDDLIETETLKGTIGEQVTPDRKSYTGFTAPSGQTETILENGALVVTYKYTRKSYTLTWELGDGIVTTEGTAAPLNATGTTFQSVRYGTPITAPIVQREGYRFTSWNSTVSNTMPSTSKTFTAQWVKTWDITWKAQGNIIQKVTVDADSKLTLPTEEVATCEGMTHIGWTETEDYTSDADAPDDFFTYAIGTVSDNKIYHAVYALSCGYTKLDWGSEVPEGKYLISTGTNTIYGQNGTTKTYLGATAYAPTRELKPEYEVYIREVGTAFAIQLLNTMWVGLASSSSTNTNLTIDSPETNADYTWKYTEKGIQNQSATSRYLQINGAGLEGRVYTTEGSGSTWHPTYLYARNNGGYYTTCQTSVAIDYDLNGGTGNMSNTRVKSGSDYIIPTAVPTQVGKTFTHWSDGTNTYAAGATINDLTNDITLTAQWEVAQHTVTLNPNYPDGKTGTFTYEAGELVDGNLVLTYDYNTASMTIADLYTSLTLDGYEFGGWYNAKGVNPGEVSGSKCTNTGNITGNKTYYAKWSKLHTVTFNTGTNNPTVDAMEGTSETGITLPAGPTPACSTDDWEFAGWWTESVAETTTSPGELLTAGSNYQPASDCTLYAVYSKEKTEEGGGTTPIEATLSFASTAQRTSFSDEQQVWEQNGITLTNTKGENDNDASVANYANPARFYANSKVIINALGKITKIVFDCNSESYATAMKNSITSNTSLSSDKVTLELDGTSDSYTISSISAQVRIDALTVTYLAESGPTTTITYNSNPSCFEPVWEGATIDKTSFTVNCGERSPMDGANGAAKITFPTDKIYDFTSAITIEATTGFVVSTSKSVDANYKSSVSLSPLVGTTNANTFYDKFVYVRAEAPAMSEEDLSGTITIKNSKGETLQTFSVTADVTCTQYTLTLIDRGVSTEQATKYYAGETINEAPADPEGVCTDPIHYVFDGWAESIVEEGATTYSKVTFPYEMPNRNTILYAVYQIQEESNYTKVTEDLADYSGEYLIVYEDGKVAFNGGLTDLDVANNYIKITIIDGNTIKSDATIDAAKFTIAKVNGGYSIKSASGYYIGWSTKDDNGLNANEQYNADKHLNKIANRVVSGVQGVLKYNKNSDQKRFRYYQSGQQTISLYKKDISYTSYPDCTPPVEPETPQALPSAFSVSATEKVQFSAGNLQYHTRDEVWRFAPEQYDVLGEQNIELGNPKFKDWVDMFGWSADGKFGVNPSNDQSNYNGEFVDWGKVFSDAKYGISGEEWYTLSRNEWYYLLYTRTNASSLKQVATVGDMIGVLLFPDDWVMPKGFEVSEQTDADGVKYYPYTIDQWKQLEAAGAVFLPAAGRRTGGWGNRTVSPHIEDKENQDNFDSEGYYRWQDNTNYYGYYWTSTKDDSDGRSYFLITCKMGADGETGNPSLPSLWDEEGRYGQSVRLVRKCADLQVVEWKENSVVVMYNGDPAQTATVTINNVQKGTATLSKVAKDIAVYELPATGLASSPNQPLEIAIGNAKALMTIPYVATATTTNVPNNSDLVILKDATFTATDEQLRNVTVYGGGMLVVDEGATLSTNSLTLRAGGVTADGNYDYVYPEFVLNGTWTNTSGKINLDYVTTKEQYYTFVAPFAVNTKDIKYPVDIYGSTVAANNTGSYEFQYYDGAARAAGNTGWMVVNEDPNDDGEYEGATLIAGQGYTFLGMPKKINGTRQTFGIHRIPMSIAAGIAMTHENSEQSITVAPHPSEKNNNSGWNLIGNPYMSTIGGLTNEDIQVGKLVHTNDANGNWTGGWHWDDPTNGQRFLVIPSNDGQSYEAVQASNATLPAFKNFFVQISNEGANALSIPRTTPAAQLLAPARRTEEVVKDVEVAIVLEQDEQYADQMDFLFNNIYTEEFERDADFTKMMNATNLNLYGVHPYDNLSFVAIDNNTARGSVAIGYQVPQAGEYTLRMSDKPYVMFDKIEALYVTDHEISPEVTTDIMSEPYRFTVANAETNHTRFTVSVILKTEEVEDGEDDGGGDLTTGVDNTTNNNRPHKFIYQDKMYILLNGVIYDAMGKQVQTINK